MTYSKKCPGCIKQTQTIGRLIEQRSKLRAEILQLKQDVLSWKQCAEERAEPLESDRDLQIKLPTPIGRCKNCGTAVYTTEGACGICGH